MYCKNGIRPFQGEKKQMKFTKTKINNAGMSLLELIIAVIIFLQAFVTSGRVNKKSGLYLDASSAAQNLMEEIKSKSFEDISMAFNYPIDPVTKTIRLGFLSDQAAQLENGSLVLKESLKEGSSYKDVRLYRALDKDTSAVTASVISTDNGKTGTFNPRTKGKNQSKYYFQISGLVSGDHTFDALVSFDGSKESGYKKQSGTASENQKNDYEVPNISKLDTESNAFLIMPQNWDENAMKAIVQGQTEYANKIYHVFNATDEHKTILDADEVYQYTKRTLYIKVEESGGTVKASAKYTLNAYNYSKKGGQDYESMSICPCHGTGKTDGPDPCFCTYESAYVPFYSSETGTELKNLFVFYYPNYNSTSAVHPLDEIVFENTSNYPVQLYVTKQRPDSQNAGNSLPTTTQEQKYRMSLTVEENPAALGQINWNTNPSLYRAQTVLRTNLDQDISTDSASDRTSVNQMKLVYQAVDTNGRKGRSVSGKSARQVLAVNGLDDKEAEDRIYKAKVEIYKAGAAQNDFPESDRIVVLDGAKEN